MATLGKNIYTVEAQVWARYVESTDSWVYTCRPEPITLAVTYAWKPMHQVEGFQVWATEHLDDHAVVVAGKWFDIEDGGNEWRPAATTKRLPKLTQEHPQGVTLTELLEEA